MILWFSGISGAGKTTIATALKLKLKRNFVHLDGDKFRNLFNDDLKYTLKDRDKNAQRLISFVKFLSDQKINIIVSANLTSNKYRIWCEKNLRNFMHIFIDANMEALKKRDYKDLYKNALKKKIKNVVGINIKFIKPKNVDLVITNNDSKKKFLKNISKILKHQKFKKIKIY